MSNNQLIEKTVEITVARMSSADGTPNVATGANVAAFMQAIYDKLSELNSKGD